MGRWRVKGGIYMKGKLKILICYGTRPEWLKIKSLYNSSPNYKLLKIQQHTTLIEDLPFDYVLKYDLKNTNRLNEIVINNLKNIPYIEDFDAILVQGDTTSAFSLALAAYHMKIPIIHLEAGLRTYTNNPYPEEFNRRAISLMASIHLCPTKQNLMNLEEEKILGEKYVVGNTVLDNLNGVKKSEGNHILITMHRRENIGKIQEWFKSFENVAKKNPEYTFIYPMHPNPAIQQHKHLLKNIRVVNPLSHEELLQLLASCKLVITDSGGIQEEACYLKKVTLVCREKTERVESLNQTSWLVNSSNLGAYISLALNGELKIPSDYKCPYGNGRTTESINNIMSRFTSKRVE